MYIAFFLVLAAGSYAFIATAQGPSVTLENPEYELQNGTPVDAGDRAYTVTSVTAPTAEDPGEATLSWTNESAPFSATLQNNATATYNGSDHYVFIANVSDPSEATLRTTPANGTNANITYDGEAGQYYVVREFDDGSRELTPYLQDEAFTNLTISEGQEFEYQGNSTTVANITTDGVLLEWSGERTEEVSVTEGEPFILNSSQTEGTEYVAHFPSDDTFVLTTDIEGYEDQIAEQEHFHERINGVWAVVIMSGLAGVLLTGLAYLPRKE